MFMTSTVLRFAQAIEECRANGLRVITEAEEKAIKFLSWENNGMTYEEKREAVEELLHEFCKANGGY